MSIKTEESRERRGRGRKSFRGKFSRKKGLSLVIIIGCMSLVKLLSTHSTSFEHVEKKTVPKKEKSQKMKVGYILLSAAGEWNVKLKKRYIRDAMDGGKRRMEEDDDDDDLNE